jgi:dTDP-L-rhamnose 4-epimerase
MKKVLILGGCGFVGSHTADALSRQGHRVTVFDNLNKQVHRSGLPSYWPCDVEFVEGDVRNLGALTKVVAMAEVIYHLAAAVGVGQSMYEISDYCSCNIQGTANLLQAILDSHSRPEKLIVASSMSIYGEGRYSCTSCNTVAPLPRRITQLKQRQWELNCPNCHSVLQPLATPEDKPLQCTSVYALSKKAQEEMALLFGETYDVPTVALRYFNIYGPRQALSNPYTGVAAIFASRLLNGNPPVVFEDGQQMRDFVNIRDVVQANLLALSSKGGDGMALNVGSGKPVTIAEVATEIAQMLGADVEPTVPGVYRAGDIRHCFADISKTQALLGYKPRMSFRQGTSELVDWLESQEAYDRTDEALLQLSARGLVA